MEDDTHLQYGYADTQALGNTSMNTQIPAQFLKGMLEAVVTTKRRRQLSSDGDGKRSGTPGYYAEHVDFHPENGSRWKAVNSWEDHAEAPLTPDNDIVLEYENDGQQPLIDFSRSGSTTPAHQPELQDLVYREDLEHSPQHPSLSNAEFEDRFQHAARPPSVGQEEFPQQSRLLETVGNFIFDGPVGEPSFHEHSTRQKNELLIFEMPNNDMQIETNESSQLSDTASSHQKQQRTPPSSPIPAIEDDEDVIVVSHHKTNKRLRNNTIRSSMNSGPRIAQDEDRESPALQRPTNKPWTEQDLQIVHSQFVKDLDISSLAVKLNRSFDEVEMKTTELIFRITAGQAKSGGKSKKRADGARKRGAAVSRSVVHDDTSEVEERAEKRLKVVKGRKSAKSNR